MQNLLKLQKTQVIGIFLKILKNRGILNIKMNKYTLRLVNLTQSKHIGIFPEQVLNWNFIKSISKNYQNIKFLNLFGYTGLTSVAAAPFSKTITHIDSIKKVVDWTKLNAKNSGFDNIRAICEDAPKFVEREIKRKINTTQ